MFDPGGEAAVGMSDTARARQRPSGGATVRYARRCAKEALAMTEAQRGGWTTEERQGEAGRERLEARRSSDEAGEATAPAASASRSRGGANEPAAGTQGAPCLPEQVGP